MSNPLTEQPFRPRPEDQTGHIVVQRNLDDLMRQLKALQNEVIASRIPVVDATEFAALTPVDGQEVYFEADAANGVIWHLRYNAGSASAYKWEFLGGTPRRSYVEAEELIAFTNVWANCTTVGPDFVAPRAGEYRVIGTASMYSSGVTEEGYIGIANASVSTSPAAPQAVSTSELARRQTMICTPVMNPAIGQTIRMQYYAVAVQHWYRQRLLEVTPVRIS